jgi:hypothetical protein
MVAASARIRAPVVHDVDVELEVVASLELTRPASRTPRARKSLKITDLPGRARIIQQQLGLLLYGYATE